MTFWEFETVRESLGGRWAVEPPERPQRQPLGASIDTRTLEPGEVFFALRGERTDGHEHIAAAARAGSPLIVVEDASRLAGDLGGAAVVVVADGAASLARLARAFREAHPFLKVIGVTGSNGKTTTVRLIDAVLRTRLRGSASRMSYNNALGLPLTVLGSRPGDQYVVCEMGTSSPGEIGALAKIAHPDVAVITSIGRAHLEELGSVEGVAREKAAILEHAREGAVGCVPAGCAALEAALKRFSPPRVFRVGVEGERGHEDADVVIAGIRARASGTSFELKGRGRFEVPLIGAHNARNAAAAAFVGRRLGLSDDEIREGLRGAAGVDGRLARVTIRGPRGSVRVVDDSYNANPESMRAALATLAGLRPGTGGRRVAVLGDMLELGEGSDAAHAEIVSVVGRTRRVHAAVLVGEAMGGAVAHAAGKGEAVGPADEGAIERAAGLIEPGDVVLIKGSRGVRLERLRDAIARRLDAPA